MADMPTQQPMPDESPAEQSQDPAQGSDANSPTKLIVGVDAGLSKVSQMLAATQVDDKIKQGVDQALQMYREAIKSLMDSGPPGDQPAPQGPPAPGGKVPMGQTMGEHQGPGAVPMKY